MILLTGVRMIDNDPGMAAPNIGACTSHGTLHAVSWRPGDISFDLQEGHVVVFTGHGKSSGAGHCVIFSPLQGSEEHMDLDQAAGLLGGGGSSASKWAMALEQFYNVVPPSR